MKAASPEAELAPIFSTSPARRSIVWGFATLLLFFGQTFHYISGLAPLWALSKAFPILTLPLALFLRNYPRFPMTRQTLVSMTWLILVPTFAAGIYFQENFFTSITAQVKLLPMFYFFSFLAVLLALRPTLHELERSFVLLGGLIAAALILMWAVIPNSWYSTTYEVGAASFFTNDSRGNRIRMSMFFPIIALFFCYRRAFFERSWRYLAAAAVFLLVTLLIVKTRSMAIGIFGVLAINTILWSTPLVRLGLILIAPIGLVGIFSVGYLATAFSTDASTGFDTRQITINKVLAFLGDDPLRWLFGVGTISPTSNASLMEYFNHFFFLADITWLGIVFEYGLIGALLILLLAVRGLFFYHRLRKAVDDDFLGSLRDYIVYVLLISSFYPMTLVPGELAVILAIFVYVWYAGDLEPTTSFRPVNGKPQTS